VIKIDLPEPQGVRWVPEQFRTKNARKRCIAVDCPLSSSTSRHTRRSPAQRSGRPHWASRSATPPGEPQFTTLHGAIPGLVTAVQSVDDEARYHVDIETDDVAAEVARLQGLGAVEESSWQGCHTLRVPGGHLICVIPVHTEPETFGDLAQTWP